MINLHQLLKILVEANGSDLHITTNTPPQIRVDGKMKPVPGSEFQLKADLVLLAMGFVSPKHEGMLSDLGVALDKRGNVEANVVNYASSLQKVYACGDMRRGQSLVVWAIREGRQCASAIDKALMGATVLPR